MAGLSMTTNPLTLNEIFAILNWSHRLSPPGNRTEHDAMALTKSDIAEQIQVQLGFPKNQSLEITETLIELIKSTLESGDDVLVSRFGKFCVKEKAKRKGRNPATGEEKILPARRVVTFKCSRNLRDKVNGGKHVRKVRRVQAN
jgi:integration host factor subunit alpha